jgi:hypothetical protein
VKDRAVADAAAAGAAVGVAPGSVKPPAAYKQHKTYLLVKAAFFCSVFAFGCAAAKKLGERKREKRCDGDGIGGEKKGFCGNREVQVWRWKQRKEPHKEARSH